MTIEDDDDLDGLVAPFEHTVVVTHGPRRVLTLSS
jgi:hypothetical protein